MPENIPEMESSPFIIARLMASAVLSKRGEAGNRAKLTKLSKAIMDQPAFAQLKQDPRSAKLMREGRGADLCALYNMKERALNGPKGPYARPASKAREDAAFLKTASGSMNGSRPATGSPAQIERESAYLAELKKRMDHAQTLLEKGVALNEKDTAELVSAAKRYNDGGTSIPGGRREARYSKQAMCILSRYMPEKEFAAYCGSINAARGAKSPADRGYVEPANYRPELMTGGLRTAKELMADTTRSLSKKLTFNSCAAAAAIQKLSGGNPNALISKQKLQAEMESYKKPGSAFMQVMNDSASRAKLASLASKGMVGRIGGSIVEDSRKYSQRAARWQMEQASTAAATGGGSQNTVAMMLAAKEVEQNAGPGSQVTNDAFLEKARSIASSPSFMNLAQRYESDADYRSMIDRELASGDKSNTVSRELDNNEKKAAEREPASLTLS